MQSQEHIDCTEDDCQASDVKFREHQASAPLWGL